MSIDPERLMAFVDGQTEPAETGHIAAALAADAQLRAKAAQWRAQSDALRAAFDPILAAPVPERLRALVAPPAKVLAFPSARANWRTLAASVTALAAAALIGFQFGAGPNADMLRTGTDGVWAKGALAAALERQASGPAADKAVAIAFTLNGEENTPCRAFRVASQGLDGLACRQEEGWTVLALGTQAKSHPDSYAPASGLSAGVLAALEGLQGSEALSAEAEAERIKAKWR